MEPLTLPGSGPTSPWIPWPERVELRQIPVADRSRRDADFAGHGRFPPGLRRRVRPQRSRAARGDPRPIREPHDVRGAEKGAEGERARFRVAAPGEERCRAGGRTRPPAASGERRRLEPDLVGPRFGLVLRQGSLEGEGPRRREFNPGGSCSRSPRIVKTAPRLLPGTGDAEVARRVPVRAYAGRNRKASSSRAGDAPLQPDREGTGDEQASRGEIERGAFPGPHR